MKLFDIFKKKAKPENTQTDNSQKSNPLTPSTIWEIENPTQFVIEMDKLISEKCVFGEKMEALNKDERLFYISQEVEREVNNGGFDQFFFNSSGNFSNEIVEVFKTIGTGARSEICQRAVDVFGATVPVDSFERQDLMEELDEDKRYEIWSDCDSDYYACEDDLDSLIYSFIIEHKASFL